ncbi:unnamed protein product [Prorocentrum cordatum]|uniref:Receptor ligand binding region domain-containing protein n=1 Tax=Prorocentrum cordatum TaxID=2364126 RepID=A0ABN9RL07_9DINO|nr:unnamed protein product [Polarella glacialis]
MGRRGRDGPMTVGGRALGRARLALALAHLPAAVSLCNDTCTNVVVRPGEVEGGPDTVEVLESGEAHELPAGTEHTSYGAEADAFDGEVVVGGPSTLSVPYSSIRVLAEISLEMRKAAQTFARWLNAERGGLQVRGARLAMKVVFVDDRGSRAQVTNATARALRARGGVHFALGPYSSGLTQYAARQADADGRLMISAGSSYTYVYEQNLTRLFGFVPPSWEIFGLRAILRAAAERDDAAAGAGAAAAAADLCGAAGCVSQLRFGMLGQGCDPGAMRDAEELFGAASHWERVTDEASRAELGLALRRLKDRAVTVLFICKLSLETLVEATRLMSEPELDYEVHALMGFGLVSSPRFLAELRMGWWQGAHWLEPIAWHGTSGSEIRGNFSNLTSQEFHALFYDQWKLEPSYFAAAQFCALCALSEAIEQADSLESDLVASAMRNLSSLT